MFCDTHYAAVIGANDLLNNHLAIEYQIIVPEALLQWFIDPHSLYFLEQYDLRCVFEKIGRFSITTCCLIFWLCYYVV